MISSLNHLRYDTVAGDFRDDVFRRMVKEADKSKKSIHARFNGEILIVNPGDDAEELIARFEAEDARKRKEWSESPEGKKIIAEREAYREAYKKEEAARNAHKTYETLPPFLQKWVDDCKNKNYGRKMDIIIAHDAILLAEHAKTPEGLQALLSKKGWD